MRRPQRPNISPTPTPLRRSTSPTSPPRISSPPLPLESQVSPPSTSSSPSISPRSSSLSPQILTPPPRLHLRTLLPSPPLPRSQRILSPRIPYPWAWRCHVCNNYYRLGVTRRCLEDGHIFCSVAECPPPPPLSPVPPASEEEEFGRDIQQTLDIGETKADTSDLRRAGQDIIKQMQKGQIARQKKKNKASVRRSCYAEFDYTGWTGYNKWRREVRPLNIYPQPVPVTEGCKHAPGFSPHENEDWVGCISVAKTARVIRNGLTQGWKRRSGRPKRNCWKDCDFPSECLHERQAEREWAEHMRAERLREAAALASRKIALVEWSEMHRLRRLGPLDIHAGGNGEVEWSDVVYDQPPTSLSPTPEERERSPFMAMTNLEDTNRSLGRLGVDCDGLGESAFQQPYVSMRRRKSIEDEKGGSLPPSPLKCSFESEELGNGILKTVKVRVRISDADGDVQMLEEEASKGRNVLLRRVEDGDERFGDEVDGVDEDDGIL